MFIFVDIFKAFVFGQSDKQFLRIKPITTMVTLALEKPYKKVYAEILPSSSNISGFIFCSVEEQKQLIAELYRQLYMFYTD